MTVNRPNSLPADDSGTPVMAFKILQPRELLAATSRARLWRAQRRTTEVADLLAPVYESFTRIWNRGPCGGQDLLASLRQWPVVIAPEAPRGRRRPARRGARSHRSGCGPCPVIVAPSETLTALDAALKLADVTRPHVAAECLHRINYHRPYLHRGQAQTLEEVFPLHGLGPGGSGFPPPTTIQSVTAGR